MGGATYFSAAAVPAIVPLLAAFFAFEACVGMYFPLIGTLRSKYLPDAYRGVIMNIFGIPLNLIVVGVFLSIARLGLTGALTVSAAALCLASVASLLLRATQNVEPTTS
jgi:riboflavin transporter FmnP